MLGTDRAGTVLVAVAGECSTAPALHAPIVDQDKAARMPMAGEAIPSRLLDWFISTICFDRLSRPRIVDQTVHQRAYAVRTFLEP
jgi:hypothetical protein